MRRLALRAAWDWPDVEFVAVNGLHGDAATAAHLLTFDSAHGRWDRDVAGSDDLLIIDGAELAYSSHAAPGDVPWLVVPYVMAVQALSGIAQDLTKMSSKRQRATAGPEGPAVA